MVEEGDKIRQWGDCIAVVVADTETHARAAAAKIKVDYEQLPELLDAMQAHLQSHFDQENQWMTETAFPPRDCHIDEHSAVLKSVGEVKALLGMGNARVCRDLVTALADWFPGHATHLDSALAHWMCKRSLGGKPVVLRRMNHEELHGTD